MWSWNSNYESENMGILHIWYNLSNRVISFVSTLNFSATIRILFGEHGYGSTHTERTKGTEGSTPYNPLYIGHPLTTRDGHFSPLMLAILILSFTFFCILIGVIFRDNICVKQQCKNDKKQRNRNYKKNKCGDDDNCDDSIYQPTYSSLPSATVFNRADDDIPDMKDVLGKDAVVKSSSTALLPRGTLTRMAAAAGEAVKAEAAQNLLHTLETAKSAKHKKMSHSSLPVHLNSSSKPCKNKIYAKIK